MIPTVNELLLTPNLEWQHTRILEKTKEASERGGPTAASIVVARKLEF